MREIKFKAYANGKWHTGLHGGDDLNEFFVKAVMPVVQYTGMKDKNGVEIYEGDLIKYTDRLRGVFEAEYEDHIKEVIYDEENLCFCLQYSQVLFTCQFSDEFEKVGTIYENQVILK